MVALDAIGVSKSVREDPAFEIAAKGSLDMDQRCFALLVAGEFQPSFEVDLVCAILQRPLATATLVALGFARSKNASEATGGE